MDEALLIARQLERERRARKSAETLLESKSLELYEAKVISQKEHPELGCRRWANQNVPLG